MTTKKKAKSIKEEPDGDSDSDENGKRKMCMKSKTKTTEETKAVRFHPCLELMMMMSEDNGGDKDDIKK